MADRPPQPYGMMPSGYNNMLQQQQQQQAQQQQAQQQQQLQQQQQQLDSHPGPGFPNVWPQQMQQPFRPRSGAGMAPTQSQMNELMMRNQNMARVQGSQQMSFGMGVGVPNMGGQQAFHDQSSNQPPNGNMAGGFPSLGGMLNSNMNAAAQQRNLLQGLPASGQRQLDMMLAHNPNFMKFSPHPQIPQRPDQSQQQQQQQPQQQQSFVNTGMNHSSPGDLFASGMQNEAIRRGSPSHPPNMIAGMPGTMGSNQQAPQRRVPLSIPELQERANQLRLSIQNEENVIHTIKMQASMNGGQMAVEQQQRLSQLQTAVNLKKEYLSKIVQSLNVQNPQGPPQQANGPGAVGWVGNPQSFDNGAQRVKPPSLQQSQTPQLQAGAIGQGLAKPQTPVNHPINGGGMPPRSDQQHLTPQQGPGQQQGGMASSSGGPFPAGAMNMNGQHPFAQGMAGAGRSTPQMQNAVAGGMALNVPPVIHLAQQLLSTISPLDRQRFEQAFKNWCTKKNIPVDPHSLQMEGRQVDLFALHQTVFREGGFRKIEQNSAWDVVAGKMGFVSFPGSEGQPPKSGPVVAHHISVNYREYLQDFDTAYIANQLEAKSKEPGHPPVPHSAQIAIAITGAKTGAQVGGNPQPVQVPQPGQPMDVRPPNQMTAMMSLAHRTVPELRSMGAPDQMINFIEGNRAALQRAHQDHQVNERLRNGAMAGQQPPHASNGEQQGNTVGPSGPQPPPFGVAAGGQGVPGHLQDRRLIAQSVASFPPGAPGMSGPLGAPLPQHQQGQVPSIQGGQHPGQGQQNMVPRAGGKEQLLQTAIALVSKWKTEFMNSKIPNMPPCEVRADQRAQYNATLEQLFRMTTELDQKLPLIYCIMRDDGFVRRCIEIGITVGYQRTLVSSSNPRLIVGLETLQKMMPEVNRMREQANQIFIRQKESLQQQHFPQQMPLQQPPQPQPVGGMPPPAHMLQDIPRPPMPSSQPPPSSIPTPQGQPQQTTPHLPAQQLRPPPSLNAPPPARRNPKQPHAGSALTPGKTMQSPSPAAAASTPPSAPTPSAMVTSPQAPKSPKSKPTQKPKPLPTKQRRQSKAMPQSPAAGGSAATPQSHASPEALSTPVPANASIKRPRDEETSGQAGPSPGSGGDMNGVANGPSPPKRAKMEPSDMELPPSETAPLDKKPGMSSQISHIKSDEDASQFFMDRMQELFDNSANTEGQESLASDLTETLSMLLKGVGSSEGGEASGSGFGSDLPNVNGREPSPQPAASLFDEFFDFSNVGDEEDTKVDTPELVSSSSSTNPSPESNISESDVGGHHHLSGISTSMKMDPKLEDVSDAVRLGTWKEIDGGEAAYYQNNEWKWEGSMNTFDHPWAIFNQ
ncbi:hypothetical protein EST38_g197 [Candolleomyces aberdarensis]|uniref:ARID domain-containing protein n=1 Tax=Candolleomyces aberdarensis TaxID=2316362 RepID=A0A4Q2E2J6_9AGAR|nr:hypothetical protein EST38_g197 [Candolleomyces aberdarensis]